jgi:hypothetical protein
MPLGGAQELGPVYQGKPLINEGWDFEGGIAPRRSHLTEHLRKKARKKRGDFTPPEGCVYLGETH